MNKRALIKALQSVVVGGTVAVGGESHLIVEVVKYKEDGDRWQNLVWKDKDGREEALETDGQKLTLWKEIEAPEIGWPKMNEPFSYGGEEYRDVESGIAQTISFTGKKQKRGTVMWRVCEADSGHKISIEIWDGEQCVYYADGELPATSVQVI